MERQVQASGRGCVARAVLAGLLASSAALGQINPASGPDVQVAASATFQAAPAVASDAAGNALVVVWQRQGAGGWDVYARRYRFDSASQLAPLGPEIQVNTQTVGCQQLPAVAADAAGSFVVVWQSDQDPGGGSGVFARRFDSAGTPLDAVELQVSTTTAGAQMRPAVAMAPDGRFLVTWQSGSQAGGQGWDVAAQAYTSGGSPAGGEVLVNSTTAGAQHSPRAAWLAAPAAGFAVVWASATGIFVRRISPSGVALDAADQPVNTTSAGAQKSPAVASDPSGNYAVAWESTDANGLASRILARRFQGVSALGGMTDLTLDASAGATRQGHPAVASDAVGSWVVSWDSLGEDGSGAAVVAAQFDNRQVPAGAKVVLDTSLTAGDQTLPALAMSQGGNLLAVWQSLTPAVDGAVIQARPASLAGGLFHTLPPCRLLDTRSAIGSLGGPTLVSGIKRVFPVVALGGCGIPATAKALSVNVTAIDATGPGSVSLYAGDAPFPGTSTVNFNPSRPTIANNAHVTLARDGTGTLAALASVFGGTNEVDIVLDVNGYYR